MSITEPISIRDKDSTPADTYHFLNEPVRCRYVMENPQSHDGIKGAIRIGKRRTAGAV
jgi:hypothetical protein